MSAPPRVIYIDKFSVVDCLKDIGGDWEYILKSDYDELQAKLTEAERLNADLLCRLHAAGVIDNAIKEIEGATK